MANLSAIRSVGVSLEKYLNNAYQEASFPDGIKKPPCTFALTTIGGLSSDNINVQNSVHVLIILYRVGMNPHLRNVGYLSDKDKKPLPVSVELHYLISFWASSAENEQLALAWALRELQSTTVLDSSILSADGGWSPEEIVQLVPEELNNEEMTRIWDAIQPDYRLSLSYVARVVRIDPDKSTSGKPVVASRYNFTSPLERES